MQIRKYEAESVQAALEQIKSELGPDAVILKTKSKKGLAGLMGKSGVEVTVAVSQESLKRKKDIEKRLPKKVRDKFLSLDSGNQANVMTKQSVRSLDQLASNTKEKISLSTAPIGGEQSKPTITAVRYADIQDEELPKQDNSLMNRLLPKYSAPEPIAQRVEESIEVIERKQSEKPHNRQEMEDLKRAIKELQRQKGSEVDISGFETQEMRDVFDQLIVNGMKRSNAFRILKESCRSLSREEKSTIESVMEAVAENLLACTEVSDLYAGIGNWRAASGESKPSFLALVGPTGVGKTTTIAKIASECVATRNLKVALINLDLYKVAAKNQLETYASLLRVPLRNVSSKKTLLEAVEDFKNYDVVLVDTTGRSQKDTEALREMEKMLEGIPDLRFFLALSATTKDQDLSESGRRFSIFRPDGIVMTKIDETSAYGGIFNISNELKLPIAGISTGQRVPEDLEVPTKERIVELTLDL